MTIRIVVADDHPVVRAGLVMLLGSDDQLEVVGQADNGVQAVELANSLQPDVVLSDLRMPDLDGVGVVRALATAASPTRVLVLTTYDHDQSIVAAIEAGAAGYLLKDTPGPDLIAAIKQVSAGGQAMPTPIAEKLAASRAAPAIEALTEREVEVLQCVARGSSNRAIADELFISVATVKTHLIHVFQKLQVDDRTAAVTTALDLGLIGEYGSPSS